MCNRFGGVLERLAIDEVLTILQESTNIPCFLQNLPAKRSEDLILSDRSSEWRWEGGPRVEAWGVSLNNGGGRRVYRFFTQISALNKSIRELKCEKGLLTISLTLLFSQSHHILPDSRNIHNQSRRID